VRAVKIAAGLGDWPIDVLRHSYGSNWLAVHQNGAALAENMGNSVDVIRQHYRKAIPPAVAREYWSADSYALTPTSSVIPILANKYFPIADLERKASIALHVEGAKADQIGGVN
jgi:hypothetical protein